jgi:DNA replication protein DnaC
MLDKPDFPSSFDELIERYRVPIEEQEPMARERLQRAAADAARDARLNRIAYAKRVSDCGERFSERTFANYAVPPGDAGGLAAALTYVEDVSAPAPWFFGPFGIGKSHLAAAIVNELCDRGTPAVYTPAMGLLDRLRATYDRNGNVREGEHDIITALVQMPVLVLDDLDKVVLSEWSAQRLYVLVNARYEAKRGIVVTSNLAPADLEIAWKDHIGKANAKQGKAPSDLLPMLIGSILDRVLEMNSLRHMRGESQRGLR